MKRLGLILVVAAFFFWLVNPTAFSQVTRVLTEKIRLSLKKESDKLVARFTNEATETLQSKGQAILGETIGLKVENEPSTQLVSDVPDSKQEQVILVDYLTQKNLRLSFKLKETYFLDIRNLPNENCFFINDKGFAPKGNEYLKLRFPENGKYNLYFDLCKTDKSKFGEIIVE